MNLHENSKCYTFKELNFDRGVLDDIVDCTYIIHLEGNGRLDHIHKELKQVQPTKKVVIMFNKGFKKCKKQLIEQVSYQDLTDAFLQCFKNAKQNHYKNILILEDDFIFDPKIKDPFHVKNIHRFIKARQDEAFIYYIGVLPLIIYPTTDLYSYNALKTLTMHSVIYSEKVIQNYDSLNLEGKHWDVIMDQNITNRYLYFKPLCYQTFPETENKQTWFEKDGNRIISYVKNVFIKLFKMDIDPTIGFCFFYMFSFFLFFMLFFAFLFLLLFIFFKKKRGKHKI